MSKAFAVTALTLSAVLGLAACSSDSSGDAKSSSTTKSQATTPVSLSGSVNNKGTKDVSTKGTSTSLEVEADNFYFGPTFIKAAPGQKIELELKNEGTVAHTFTSPTLGVDKELQPDTKATIEITVPKSGPAPFYCRFHKDNGMQGAVFTTS